MTLEQAMQIAVVVPWAMIALGITLTLYSLGSFALHERAEVRRLTILVERSKGGRR